MRIISLFIFFGCNSQIKSTTEDNISTSIMDEDGDGYFSDEDCDDTEAQIYPGALEICDALDNNCDGSVDEGVLSLFYQDEDGDGFGTPDIAQESCQASEGFVPIGTDCDDTSASTFPGAVEVCDTLDNDCDGEIDNGVGELFYRDEDGDGYGVDSVQACELAAGLSQDGGDCNDADSAIFPDAEEICDDLDNDCDELIDEDGINLYYGDVDGDGYGNPEEQFLLCAPEEGMVELSGDCDDLDTNINPGVEEYCDYVDNNCDGTVDESTAVDAQEFPIDGDGDGFGHPTQTQRSCFVEIGLSANNSDCDDTQSSISPDAQEECDGLDNNCDGSIDEATSIDAVMWFSDGDGDGFGDAQSAQSACSAPSGTVADNTDCDDENEDTYPNATEVCDEIDNDCDQLIDSVDPDVTGETTWYIDVDEDGYGASGFDLESCVAPTGYVSNNTDCDNSEPAIYPGADELCNTFDDDCDGTIDESDALDAQVWFLDGDGDGFGDAANPLVACDTPSSHTDNDLDCDDGLFNINPEASEIYDLLDNDCDGAIDEDLWLGSGTDGDLDVSTPIDFSTHIQPTRIYPDAVSYTVTSISAQEVELAEDGSGIVEGDEVVLINLQGTSSAHTNVGVYEFVRVDAVNGSTISFATPIVEVFGESGNGDISGQTIVLQRVPQYQDVQISAELTTQSFDGSTGGMVVFRARGDLELFSGGRISVDGAGYRGGATGGSYNCDSFQGESYAGLGSGEGNGLCSAYNESTGQWSPNFGGGGAHITGAGGNYGGGATGAASWDGGNATAPQAGNPYGVSDLSLLFFGSGGGGVWNGSPGFPGPGGNGGGMIYIGALSISALDASSISAQGLSTPHWAIGSYTYGAGGGAGGSIYLEALSVSITSSAVDISGGFGYTSVIRNGGHGGVGRAIY